MKKLIITLSIIIFLSISMFTLKTEGQWGQTEIVSDSEQILNTGNNIY